MQSVKALGALLVVATALANSITAGASPFAGTGEFVGHGRQCDGTLSIHARTIEWDTPFARCAKHPYVVVERDLNGPRPIIVFELKGRSCGFGVISLQRDPAYPDDWIAKGYRNLEAYKHNSTDFLGCGLERQVK